MGIANKPHVIVAAGIIWKGSKILISKRPQKSHLGGFWEFPGGKLKEGESLEDCLRREILEELGLCVHVSRVVLSVDHEYTQKTVSLHFFDCIWKGGDARALGCDEFRWIRPSSISTFQFPPPDRHVVELIQHRTKTETRVDRRNLESGCS
jgi:mutator protein MutT